MGSILRRLDRMTDWSVRQGLQWSKQCTYSIVSCLLGVSKDAEWAASNREFSFKKSVLQSNITGSFYGTWDPDNNSNVTQLWITMLWVRPPSGTQDCLLKYSRRGIRTYILIAQTHDVHPSAVLLENCQACIFVRKTLEFSLTATI